MNAPASLRSDTARLRGRAFGRAEALQGPLRFRVVAQFGLCWDGFPNCLISQGHICPLLDPASVCWRFAARLRNRFATGSERSMRSSCESIALGVHEGRTGTAWIAIAVTSWWQKGRRGGASPVVAAARRMARAAGPGSCERRAFACDMIRVKPP